MLRIRYTASCSLSAAAALFIVTMAFNPSPACAQMRAEKQAFSGVEMPKVLPLHQVIDVDVYLPGCPPDADRIRRAVVGLLDGTLPANRGEDIRFG